jgi:hypothetical protein
LSTTTDGIVNGNGSERGGPGRTGRRRRHPARAARILTAGLSATAVLSITAALELGHRGATATTSTVPAAPPPSSVGVPPDGTGRAHVPSVSPQSPRAGTVTVVPPPTPSPSGGSATPDATTHGSR